MVLMGVKWWPGMQDHKGQPIGKAHNKPILDTKVYDMGFINSGQAEIGANIIGEIMYAHHDIEKTNIS